MEMNNEAKVRRSTMLKVLKTAKVMSYEDIEEARLKHAAKDAAKGQGKRGRKRKSAAVKTDKDKLEPELELQVACATKEVKGKRGRKHNRADTLKLEVALMMETLWRALVARMF
jgi:hypothetical protein